jgi:alanine racemase
LIKLQKENTTGQNTRVILEVSKSKTMNLILEKIIFAIQAQFIGSNTAAKIDAIATDSRSLQNNANSLFFALVGPHHDGHQYIESLIEKGVQNFVVTQIPNACQDKANFLVVNDTLEALQKLAAYYRHEFHFPIIGITGSNGKTIVKEWLNYLLAPDFTIIRSPKSYNSQVGVPLSIMGINENHNLGVFEAGISTVGEMEKLEAIIKPTIGIITNIGSAHDEGFANTTQKIKEKATLFKSAEVLIHQKDPRLDPMIPSNCKSLTWSFHDTSATVLLSKKIAPNATVLDFNYSNNSYSLSIPFTDEASIENAISCLLVLLYFNYDEKTIRERMERLYPIEMRLKVKNGIHNSTLIDDSYSADFQSLKIALDFLESQKQHGKKTVILSDIYQSGLSNEELYHKVAHLIQSNNISRIICIGETITAHQDQFENAHCYPNTAAFITDLETLSFENETILIKGARSFGFEKIVSLLEEKTHETVLEINLNALSHNLNYFKSKLEPTTKLMVMVKAFGYGSGGFEIAKLLEHHKVDYLGVAFADEGIALRNAGITLPIMVLNPETTSFEAIIQHQLEPEVYSLKGLKSLIKIAEQKKLTKYPIHLKLDTGMHRLGFEAETIPELIALLKGNESVEVKSILSHLATSDQSNTDTFALTQIELFERLSTELIHGINNHPIRHILNTSGISNYSKAQFDMVRLGIGLYGISNDAEEQQKLENVGTLKSIISQIRTIPAGDSVGYGRRFMAEKVTKVATIPIGYADGISRQWGNGLGYVLINNQKAPIIGSICMDMLMVDSTAIDCEEGDEVIIFGEALPVSFIAEQLQTIPYEILTSISQRVKRVFFRA